MQLTRRRFMQTAGMGLAAFMMPGLANRAARAAVGSTDPIVVLVFQRFGADGLHMVIPDGDPYYKHDSTVLSSLGLLPLDDIAHTGDPKFANGWRPTVSLPRPPGETIVYKGAPILDENDNEVPVGDPLPLAGEPFFKLHPQFGGLQTLFDAGKLDIVHAVGNTQSASHFEAQDAMDRAVAPLATETRGWLNRLLVELAGGDPATVGQLAGISLNTRKQLSLLGEYNSLATARLSEMKFDETNASWPSRRDALEDMFASFGGNILLQATAAQAQAAVDGIAAAAAEDVEAGIGVTWRDNQAYARSFRDQMMDAARLIRYDAAAADGSKLGVRVIAVHANMHWDHHDHSIFHMWRSGAALSDDLKSFQDAIDVDGYGANVLTLVITEFGRTVDENGGMGTDHADAGVIFAQGDPVVGGRVLCKSSQADPQVIARAAREGVSDFDFQDLADNHGRPLPANGTWVGLTPANLRLSRKRYWLFASTDYRDVFAEVAQRHMGVPLANLPLVIPGQTDVQQPWLDYAVDPAHFIGLLP